MTVINLALAVRSQCADLDAGVVEAHFRRLPPAYFERYSATDIVRHVRLLAGLARDQRAAVEMRPLASTTFEVLVVGVDHTGTMACITAALAAAGFDLEDVEVASYLPTEANASPLGDPCFFVIVLRVSGNLRGRPPANWAVDFQSCLEVAFGHLAQGNLLEAQAVAAQALSDRSDPNRTTAYHADQRQDSRPGLNEGTILGGDFRIQRKLASGGMCEVYLATQLSLSRTVAIKLFYHAGSGDD